MAAGAGAAVNPSPSGVDHHTTASTAVGVGYVDIEIGAQQTAPVVFTLLWTDDGRWEGRDYEVAVS